jgi:trk system potassium uptake protein TrkH
VNIRVVIRVVSSLVAVIGLCMATSVPVAWLMGDAADVVWALLACSAATFLAGLLVSRLSHGDLRFTFREGFAIVTFGWIFASVFGGLPLYVVGGMHWYDAIFETMSGFTTTGASVLDNTLILRDGSVLGSGIADFPAGVLYWRSLTHWLGGMGIVVLSVAILPSLGIGSQQLFHAEVPGPTSDQLTPRIADSAKILWGVYVLLSVVETALLMVGGMSLFDAWCHTCGTMATGGFSTQQASVGAYNSVYIDSVITLFMFLAGANFVLHFQALRGKPLKLLRDEEFRWYFLLTLAATLTVTIKLMGGDITTSTGIELHGAGFGTALRYAAFQVVSILTTTGFATADFNLWPAYCTLLLVILMFVGGCGGSTGGGMKVVRLILLVKYGIAQVERCIFRRSVSNVRLNHERVDPATLHKALGFFFLFVGLFVLASLALCLLGVDDVVTATSATIAALGNIGPGLAKVGPACTYAWMTPAAKGVLTFMMLLGRLELYTVLVLFLRSSYR